MQIVPLDHDRLPGLAALAGQRGLLPQHHPVWMEVLAGIGEECRGLVAIEDGHAVGWLLYTIARGAHGTVVSSLPLILYGGPAVPTAGLEVSAQLLDALRVAAEQLGADVLSVGTSPFLTQEAEAIYRRALGTTHELENFVQLHDIRVHPLEALEPKRRRAMRSEINRGIRHGLRVVPVLDARQFEEWLAIYRERYVEIGATPYPNAFHRGAFEAGVPAGAAEFWGVLDGERLIGGVLFLIASDIVDYFSSAFLSTHRELFPTTLLLNEAFHAFMARGITRFNWQSSPNRQGVFKYKARWGAREWRHYYLATLFRPDTQILQTTVAEIRRAYPLRFVLPFSLWPEGTST